MKRYRPQVVVTYDENGNYGHPDHIQAHRIAVAAAEATGIPRRCSRISARPVPLPRIWNFPRTSAPRRR
ncbi:PIG-L family deacetylase [Streptosporangium lutulentum]|uniref:PIG-L family deacetylase n=1 Tax=Streptosporangium lutulentum TaxID=1461250 RepID=UPI003520AD76